MKDSIENNCEGNPSSGVCCYEFWERVAIDMGENHLTLAEEQTAEFTAKRMARETLCSKCKKQKEKEIEMENQIVITPDIDSTEITIMESSIVARDSLIQRANSISEIKDSREADNAASVLKDITTMLKKTEEARTLTKKPVLDLGKKIDSIAKEFSAPLQEAKAKCSSLIVAYNQEVERKQREEEERIRKEQEEAQRKLEEAKAKSENGTTSFEAFLSGHNEVHEAEKAVEKASMLTPAAMPKKASGTSTYTVKSFEITNEQELLKSHPELFSPDEKKIRAFIKLIPNNAIIPGLKIIETTKVKSL